MRLSGPAARRLLHAVRAELSKFRIVGRAGAAFKKQPNRAINAALWILLCTHLLTGCNRGLASAKAKLRSTPFSASVAMECEELVTEYERTHRWLWKSDALTNHAAITSLRPQCVQITQLGDVLVCDIQITGGFSHSGILYTPKPAQGGRHLTRGNWQVEQLGQKFYWYQE